MTEFKNFKELFEYYDFTVETFGENSFIATNGIVSVPYTECNRFGMCEMAGISLLATPAELKKTYENEKYIGHRVWSDYMNSRLKFKQIGGICNHDHAIYEVEMWLRAINKK